MIRGQHARRRSARAIVIVSVVAGVVLLTGGAALSALRYEHSRADVLLPGVIVGGVDVGGLTRQAAIDAVDATMSRQLATTITVMAARKTWVVTRAELGQRADVEAAVDRAFELSGSMGTLSRFWHRVHHTPVQISTDVALDEGRGVGGFAADVAQAVRVDPVDASITERGDDVSFSRSKAGRVLEQARAVTKLRSALVEQATSVTLPVRVVHPRVTEKTIGPTIVVRVDRNRLYLYEGFHVRRSFPVATAMPGFTTPVGNWTVYDKAVDPIWHNPALDGWGAGEPAIIPGGPGNPMGPRALYLSAPGLIRIHGTNDESSIGHYASHGCIRLHNADIVQLYPLVPIGTAVLIVGHRPY
ncbi:MAG: L,D-transpeptidase/peptidoglycan binding protein [Actinomycetota bacterium]|nr:L,D-transpeptidase/peptidoglycan binding protein [Actinomycetota bacterium]